MFFKFYKKINNFLRKFICNKECEIVFIEDNCKIHQSEKVENEIINMNIAIIPTVQYSPSLNGVAEWYFGVAINVLLVERKINNNGKGYSIFYRFYFALINSTFFRKFNWAILSELS